MPPLDQLTLGGEVESPPIEHLADEDLTAQALAADPDTLADAEALSLWELDGRESDGLLPSWYMPVAPAGTRRLQGWRRRLAWFVIITFLVIDAVGLCSTYGPLIFKS